MEYRRFLAAWLVLGAGAAVADVSGVAGAGDKDPLVNQAISEQRIAELHSLANQPHRIDLPAGGCPNYPCKQSRDRVDHRYLQDRIEVRFNRGLMIRVRDGALSDLGTGALNAPEVQAVLAKYAACEWRPLHQLDERKLDELQANAERNLGVNLPADLNLSMILVLQPGMSAEQAAVDLNALSIVQMAEGMPAPVAPPMPTDWRPNQRYLYPSTDGVNIFGQRLYPGGFGSAVRIADIEYSWNLAHEDLPALTLLGPAPVDPFNDNNHGTAVLGEVFGLTNGWGVEGGTPSATGYVVAANTAGGYNVAGAITTALGTLGSGDVILIEQQIAGPNYVPGSGSQFGLVAVEWNLGIYNAVLTAIGNRVHVVEAAGNGSQNLDDAAYGTGNGGHYPFLAGRDSGAIIVGAGAAPSPYGSTTDRSRLSFSNYGSRLNVQGWGEGVYTTGYGDLFNSEGVNRRYTSTFGGTSSASPIVTSAVATFNSVIENISGTPPVPSFTRTYLISTGIAQTSGANPSSQNIGPRPNVQAALNAAILAPPSNDACGNAIPLAVSDYRTGRLSGATNDGPATCGSSSSNADVWYSFTAPNYPGTLLVTTCGTHDAGETDTGIDTVLTAFTACGGAEIACNDDDSTNIAGCTVAGGFRDSTLLLPLTPGQSVRIRVAAFGLSARGPFAIQTGYRPANDDCANATPIGGNGTFFGTIQVASGDGAASCTSSTGNPDVWFRYTACANGSLYLTTCGTHDLSGQDTGIDTVLSVFSACGGTELACNDDASSVLDCFGTDVGVRRDSALTVPSLAAGQSVLIRVSKFSFGPVGPFRLNAQFTQTNDTCTGATPVTGGTLVFDTTCATSDGFDESLCLNAGSPSINNDIWFSYIPNSSGPVRIDTCGSALDTRLAVYIGCPTGPNAANIYTCSDDSCSLQSISNFYATAGVSYKIRVGGYQASIGPGVLHVYCPPDFNRDGAVTVQDIFDFLNAWFSGASNADFNLSGSLSVQDIFDFLNAWFAGC